MKTLYLLRHAKSSWEYTLEDHNRPLQEKGIRRIEKVAKEHQQEWGQIQAVYSSPANRALHTAVIAARGAGLSLDRLHLTQALYTFNPHPVLDFVKQLPNTLSRVMLVGHNPAFTSTANTLGIQRCPELKTASWARIRFSTTDWASVTVGESIWGITSKQE